MHFIDLESRLTRIREKVDSRIATVLDHGQYILGPEPSDEYLFGGGGIEKVIESICGYKRNLL